MAAALIVGFFKLVNCLCISDELGLTIWSE